MTSYRRNFVPGGSFFFTVNLADRRLRLLTDYIDALRAAFQETRQRHPFTTDAMVVLPDHLHCIWQLPSGDADFSGRWRLLKGEFTKLLLERAAVPDGSREGERGVAGAECAAL